MSAVLHASGEFTPILSALDAMRTRHGTAATHGIAPGLVVTDPVGWIPASRFADGSQLPELLSAAHERWGGSPHAVAALAWKSYTYWLALPAVVGFATAQRVPDMSAANVLVRVPGRAPFLEFGLRSAALAVRPDDPLAGQPGVEVVTDLAGFLRRTVLDAHLTPILDQLHGLVRLGRRTLLGSLASGVAHGMIRARDAVPGPVLPAVRAVLAALAVDDLVEVTAELAVRRHSCCLAFTLPQPKVCQGCCLRP
jgi:hypothetical protein